MPPSLFSDRELKELKRDLIQKVNKGTPLHLRLYLVLLGLAAAFSPGQVAVIIGIQIAKKHRANPVLFEMFRNLAQVED